MKQHLRTEVQVMNFVEVRLRPDVRIQQDEVESYYQHQLLPDLQKNGGKPIPLDEVEPRIRELLTEQRIDEMLDAWLHNLRQQADIHSSVADSRSECSWRCGGGFPWQLRMAEEVTKRHSHKRLWIGATVGVVLLALVVSLALVLAQPQLRGLRAQETDRQSGRGDGRPRGDGCFSLEPVGARV